MEARYALRKRQLLDECQMDPQNIEPVMPRLHTFMKPFVRIFQGQAAGVDMPKPMCVACCRTWNAKTSNGSPIVWANLASRCKASLGGTHGTMPGCARSCGAKSRRTWDKAMGCWCSILLGFPSPVGSRWA